MAQPIAIVGLSLRYPGFCGPSAFFDSCRDSRSRFTKHSISAVQAHHQNDSNNWSNPYQISNDLYGSIRDMSWIDARRFRVPPSDIDGDPSPFLCLQVASEALRDHQAGRPSDYIPRHRTGVVIGRGDHPHRGLWAGLQGGSGLGIFRELLLEHSDLFTEQQADALVHVLIKRMQPAPDPSKVSTLVSNVISGLVANRLDLQGPNFLVDAACTSAVVAIQQSIRSLDLGETDLMLVGAAQATMEIPIMQMFSTLGAISNSDIQPFNALIDGTLLSEGVGFVALKRLDDARRDSDRIYGIIRGLGLASDGNDSSILAPSSRGQILAMQNTYDELEGIDPGDVGYIEAHATGINLGDSTELRSIQEVFHPQERKRPLALGALKSLIGHSIPASGMAALIRATYAVSYGVYPGSRCDQPLDLISFGQKGMYLPKPLSPWYEKPDVPRRAAINCFGFGGINGHVVIEQNMPPVEHKLLAVSGLLKPDNVAQDDLTPSDSNDLLPRDRVSTCCPVNLVCLSFSSEDELQLIASQALSSIDQFVDQEKSILCFGQDSRQDSSYRIGLVDRDLSSLKTILQSLHDHPDQHHRFSHRISVHEPDFAVMLPGEALIPFGHLSELARFIPSVKSLLEFVDTVSDSDSPLADLLHPAWAELLTNEDIEALQASINHHDSATKVLFVVSVAYFGLLRTLGLTPSALVGHSTGEINALMLGGVLNQANISDIKNVLLSFNKLYSDSSYLEGIVEGNVVLVSGLSDEKLEQCLSDSTDIYLVSDNSPSHRVIFSHELDFEQLSLLVGQYGGFVLPTPLDRAYHTPLFGSGAEVMQNFYESLSFGTLLSKVYSCCTAEQYPIAPSDQVQLLVKQWMQPVRFRQTLENMYRDGHRLFLEVNASRTLLGFAESTFRGVNDVDLFSTGSSKPLETIDAFAQSIMNLWLKGLDVHWDKWDDLFAFSDDLSLPHITRPPNAVSIPHDLHQFSSEDYKAAWQAASISDNGSISSVEKVVVSNDSNVTNQPSPSSSSKIVAKGVVSEHQEVMRRVLDSLDRNTLLMLQRLKSD